MGKTKRDSSRKLTDPCFPQPRPPCFSGTKPCSSKVGLLSEEKLLHSVDSGELKHLPSIAGIKDCSKKFLKAHNAIEHQEKRLESILLKRSRDRFGHHYSRRISKNYTGTSTSSGRYTGTSTCGKDITTQQNNRLFFKLPIHSNSESARHSESLEETHEPDRIGSSSFLPEPMSVDVMKAICRICGKSLRRRTDVNILSSREIPVVAVLVCGHVYHADCLEQKTSTEDQHDPDCPSCLGLMDIEIFERGKEKAVDVNQL